IGSGSYTIVRERLEALAAGAKPNEDLLAVLRKPASDLALDRHLAESLLDATEVLRRLYASPETDSLLVFRQKFLARYDTRFVPLLEVLDEELGIGLPGFGPAAADDLPLLKDVPLREKKDAAVLAPMHAVLLEKVGALLRDGQRELLLTDADIDRMAVTEPLPLPDSFAAIGILAGDATFVLHAITGP